MTAIPANASGFRVERVVLRRVRVPLIEPFRISNGSVSEKESIVLELYCEDNIGYGEASPMSGSFYSSETPETTWRALADDLVPDLLSRTLESPVEYATLLNDYTKEPFARAGIEGAVWHLVATRLKTTINSLLGESDSPSLKSRRSAVAGRGLGGGPSQTIDTPPPSPLLLKEVGKIASGLAVGIYDSTEELVNRIAHYLEDGYQRVKIKIMPGWDVEPLTAVRKRFPHIALMADANAAYRWPEHAEVLKSLDAFRLMMIEQPLGADAFAEMAEMRRKMKTPICVDESADSMSSLEEIIQHGSASVVNIKVQRVGGLWNAKKMHDRAVEAGLDCWLGTMPELGIASAQALAIATLPGFVYPTDIEASSRWFADDIISPAIMISPEGFIVLPKSSAMGYEVDRVKLERFTIDTQEFSN